MRRGTDALTIGSIQALLVLVIAVGVSGASGCTQLRLPAIDTTGTCLFAPKPTTTTFALPGCGGEGCLGCLNPLGNCDCLTGLKSCFSKPNFAMPTPAFVTPADPPPCKTPAIPPPAKLVENEPCVPGGHCGPECAKGPPAVLFGNECDIKDLLHLPKRGKRGCILLSPQKIVAPVGGEVLLSSGICGTDGYLQMNEKLEWMLTPDSVGTFIEVGDDDPGMIHRLAGSKVRPEKKAGDYAIGITGTKRTLITRGNLDPRDDVTLEKGQTWLSISSPSEGTSRVTVLAPESECWDNRKATATIYWVDARWQFPGPQIVPAGTTAELTTRVTRAEGSLPATGWKVRYEILNPELGTFAGTGGSSVVEVTVDEAANATARLIPNPGTSGTAAIDMRVIRPGGVRDNIPTLTLGRGQTFVTWSSPRLDIRAGGPAVASFEVPYQVAVDVRNPGDQPATNVRVDFDIPPGTQVVSADSFARVLPNSVTWEIGTLPAKTRLDLFLDLASQSSVELAFTARADGLSAEDLVRIDVFRPSLSVRVEPVDPSVEAGQPATFNIDVTNTGDRPLRGVYVFAEGDEAMIHENGGRSVRTPEDENLQPGDTTRKKVIFTPTESGRRCIDVTAFAEGGQRAGNRACVTAINPVPKTPRLTAKISGSPRVIVGGQPLVQIDITNQGRGPATNTRIEVGFPTQLRPVEATTGADNRRAAAGILSWPIAEIAAGQTVQLDIRFDAVAANPNTQVGVTAVSAEGSRADDRLSIAIEPAATSPAVPPRRDPVAGGPPPMIPPDPEPLTGTPPSVTTPVTPPGPRRSEQLQVSLFSPVNPARINEPIRYSLRVRNDSSEPDGQIGVQFRLPDGVRMQPIVRTLNPELAEYRRNGDIVSLAYIPRLDPGEEVRYEITLESNQPQTFEINVQARSNRNPTGVRSSIQTTVIP